MNPYGYYQLPQMQVEYHSYVPAEQVYSQPEQYQSNAPVEQNYYHVPLDQYDPNRQPQQLERRVNQLERQNERQEREINQLQRRLQRVNQRLRAVENRFHLPFTPFDGEY
ncbi:hypothetical protein ACIQXV_03050 [Neobacillus sp. NPDC097160]|uniref:hypothetical protein n=1 Tax=Neobacillus sp. NPDC097160 TaxID=3364298 RepID=UPI00382AC9E8